MGVPDGVDGVWDGELDGELLGIVGSTDVSESSVGIGVPASSRFSADGVAKSVSGPIVGLSGFAILDGNGVEVGTVDTAVSEMPGVDVGSGGGSLLVKSGGEAGPR